MSVLLKQLVAKFSSGKITILSLDEHCSFVTLQLVLEILPVLGFLVVVNDIVDLFFRADVLKLLTFQVQTLVLVEFDNAEVDGQVLNIFVANAVLLYLLIDNTHVYLLIAFKQLLGSEFANFLSHRSLATLSEVAASLED